MADRKQINFTIVPEDGGNEPRTYANFCAVNHTPFDFTLTFCEVMPLSEKEIREAEAAAAERGTARFTALQNQYSLVYRVDDADVLPLCRELGIGYVPYFPLASGLLTGKYRPGQPPAEGRLTGRTLDAERLERVEALARFATDHGHTLLDLAISALASTPGIAGVIAGATRPEQVRANASAGRWHLSSDELEELAAR